MPHNRIQSSGLPFSDLSLKARWQTDLDECTVRVWFGHTHNSSAQFTHHSEAYETQSMRLIAKTPDCKFRSAMDSL